MKLELDINSVQNHSPSANVETETSSEEVKKALRSGIKAAKEGNRAEARQMLLQVTEAESNNETAWLWLASISEYPEELLIFLQNVLKINPENERAIEWSKQTKSLLSKTFVQRGINASHANQKEFGKQCFMQAIVHDNENEMAWLWLASSADRQEDKLSHLNRVLQLNPENETALSSLAAVKNQISQANLKKANAAAISGDHETAKGLLETILKSTPKFDEAWVLKAFFANDFYEKIHCYEQALEINPANDAAQSGLNSLKPLMVKTVNPPADEVQEEAVGSAPEPVSEFVSGEYADQDVSESESEMLYENIEAGSESFEEENSEHIDQVEDNTEEAAVESGSYAKADLYSFHGSLAAAQDEQENSFSEPLDHPTQELDEEFVKNVEPAFRDAEKETVQEVQFGETADEDDEVYSNFESSNEMVSESSADSKEEYFDHDFKEENQPTVEFAPVDEGSETVTQPAAANCPFCFAENDTQAVSCDSCHSVLSMSDLEMVLAHRNADQEVVLRSIERMEVERSSRQFASDELQILGIAYLNVQNFRKGLSNLQEALRLNPNDVVLSSKIHTLEIRINEIEAHDQKAQENPVRGKTILVVDDSPTVRKLISGKLEKCGHSVIAAVDGMDALAKINEVIPDLVLLDITMPRLDGYQVCKLIRNNEVTKDVPIVMISGKDGFFDKVRGRMAGSSGYITKPFGPDILMKTIESYLE